MTFSAHYRRVRGPDQPQYILGLRVLALFVIFCVLFFTTKYVGLQTLSDASLFPPVLSLMSGGNANAFPKTKYNLALNKTKADFWSSITPSFKCPAKILSRLGQVEDGGRSGKWICSLASLKKYPTCAIYSFSSQDNADFEVDLASRSNCTVYMYNPFISDTVIASIPSELRSRIYIERLTIGSEESGDKRTLELLMELNGNRWLDLVSIDIPSGEWFVLERILSDFRRARPLPIGHLLVQFNVPEWLLFDSVDVKPSYQLVALLRAIENAGLRLFHNSGNDNLQFPHTAGLSFINVDALGKLEDAKVLIQLNKGSN